MKSIYSSKTVQTEKELYNGEVILNNNYTVIAGERNEDVDYPGPGVIRFKLYNYWRQHLIIVSLNPHCRADLPRLCQISISGIQI